MPPVRKKKTKNLSSSSLHRYVILTCAQVQAAPFKTPMHEWSVGFHCAEDKKGWGVALRRNTVSLWSSTRETQVTLTQTAIWHVTVRERERNATGDRCEPAHCATPVGNRTPQWQPSPPPISGQRAARLQTQVPPPLAHPQPRYLSSTRKHPLSRFTGYLIVDLLVVDSHSCCCSHSCIVSPICSAPMTSVSPCTIPQTRPTKLALVRGQDNKQRIRHAKQQSVSSAVEPGIKMCYSWTDCNGTAPHRLGLQLVLTRTSCVSTKIWLLSTHVSSS